MACPKSTNESERVGCGEALPLAVSSAMGMLLANDSLGSLDMTFAVDDADDPLHELIQQVDLAGQAHRSQRVVTEQLGRVRDYMCGPTVAATKSVRPR